MPVSFNKLLEQFTQLVLADRVTDTSELFKYDKLVLGEGDNNGKNYTYFFDINTGELIEKFPYGEGYVVGIDRKEYYKLKVEAELLYDTEGRIKLLKLTQNKNQYVYNYIMSHAKHIYPTKMTPAELYVRAFLSTIRVTENGGNEPLDYNSLYGGGVFTEKSYDECQQCYAKHPNKKVPAWGRPSTAAGAYQFLYSSWRLLKYRDFSPLSQDRAALDLIKGQENYNPRAKGVLNDLFTGNILNAAKKLNGTWTSLPGGSQEALDDNEFLEVYKNFIKNELKGITIIYTKQGELLKNFVK